MKQMWLSALLIALLPVPAFAFDCAILAGAASTTMLTDLPSPVAHSLADHVPNLAPVDAHFNGGDALLPGQTQLDRRLIGAFHKDRRWVIAYEAAGIGYHDVVVAYDVFEDGKHSTIAAKLQTVPARLCETMECSLNQDGPVDRYW